MTDARKTVLIVDDDDELREVIARILQGEGFETSVAANGREALILLRGGLRPSVILLDLRMPVMSGWEFLEAIRPDSALSGIPILALSAGTAAPSQTPGVSGFLAKPVELDALLESIARASRLSA